MSEPATIDLYWIPLGAGDASHCVRWNGRVFEAFVARHEGRPCCRLFHSALLVSWSGRRFAIEMAPEWSGGAGEHGAVCVGPVGLRTLGASRWFRYEVRCWRDGVIPDLRFARAPVAIATDDVRTRRLLDLAPAFPTATWGRDEFGVGEMWNSNSLTSWLLASSGHDTAAIAPPTGGRAPGWAAGLAMARGNQTAVSASWPIRRRPARVAGQPH